MRNREAVGASGGAGRGPVSRKELEALRTRRGDPAPVLEYSFGEPTRPKLRKLDLLREARARHVESRLRSIEGHIENEFACAVVTGRAKFDFERSR
jgi:hypothetical protein